MTEKKKSPPKKPAREKARKKRPMPKQAAKKDTKPDPAEEKIKTMETEIKALNDKLLRAMAEVENTRRRAEREASDARAYGVTGFARDMLNVSDNFKRALEALDKDARDNPKFKPFIEGVEMTGRELKNILERHGIKKINPKGEAFDHNFHQAMFEIESKDHDPGTVIEVVQEGYVIRDRLLRPAMVGVAKRPEKKPEEKPQAEKESGEKQ